MARVYSSVVELGMSGGRLIRVSKYRGDPNAVAYIVATPDAAKAMDILRSAICKPGDDIEDLGRVSEPLLAALNLTADGYVRL